MTSSKMQSKVTFATDQDRDRAASAIAAGNLAALAGVKVIVEMTSEPHEVKDATPKFYDFDEGRRFALRPVTDYRHLRTGERWATKDSTGFSVYERHFGGRNDIARGVNRAEAQKLVLEGKRP